MTTWVDLIADSLRELSVLNEVEPPSAEQGAHALRKANQMLAMWEEDGIKLGWFEETDTSADVPIPPYAERGVTLKLAIALAPSYGGAASVTPALIAEADDCYGLIVRKAVKRDLPQSSMSHMAQGEGKRSGNSILTDS